MAQKLQALVFDSWAIMAYLEDEPSGAKVADMIVDARERSLPLLMSMVNAGEVWYLLARSASAAEADRTIVELRSLGIQLEPVEWSLAREAARYKSRHKMSFADCFAAALAKQKSAQLVTGDHEFDQVSGEVKIIWLSPAKK